MVFRVFFVLAACAFCVIPAPVAASSALDAYQWNLTGSQIAANCKREIAAADKAIGGWEQANGDAIDLAGMHRPRVLRRRS